MTTTTELSPYQGQEVLKTSVAVRNAGDGLSQALGIDPEELKLRSTVYVVLECEVKRHEHQPIDGTDALELKQILRAGNATMVDGSVVKEMIDQQADRIKRAREAAVGTQRLPTEEEAEKVHADGGHAEERDLDHCPECQAEVEAEEAGD